MGMMPTPFTLNAIACELGRDRRTVARALRDVKPDGAVNGRKGWFISTALRALDRVEGRRGTGGSFFDDDHDLQALESAARRVDEVFDQLKALPDVKARRQLVQSGGAGEVIGQLVDAFDRVEQRRLDDSDRVVMSPVRDQTIGQTIGELLSLCSWRLEPRRRRRAG
jgi:hypothetical protein